MRQSSTVNTTTSTKDSNGDGDSGEPYAYGKESPQGFDSSGECEEASMPRVDAAIRVMIPTARDFRFEGGEKLDQVIRIVSKHSRPR